MTFLSAKINIKMTINKFLYKNRSFAMNTFLKNSFIRHFDVRGVKMGQGQNVSFSFSNDGVQREGCNTLQYLQRNGGTGFGVGQGVVVAR